MSRYFSKTKTAGLVLTGLWVVVPAHAQDYPWYGYGGQQALPDMQYPAVGQPALREQYLERGDYGYTDPGYWMDADSWGGYGYPDQGHAYGGGGYGYPAWGARSGPYGQMAHPGSVYTPPHGGYTADPGYYTPPAQGWGDYYPKQSICFDI